MLVVYARLRNFDFRVVESARDLGASPLRAFFTVTLPIIRPTVVGAALIAMALSLDDFVITYFTISGGVTLPTFVFGMIRTALTPKANAIGTLILVMTVGTTLDRPLAHALSRLMRMASARHRLRHARSSSAGRWPARSSTARGRRCAGAAASSWVARAGARRAPSIRRWRAAPPRPTTTSRTSSS